VAASVVQFKAGAVNTGDATVTTTALDAPTTAGNHVVLLIGSDDYATEVTADFTQSNECAQETFMGAYLWWKESAGGETQFSYEIGSAATSCWIVLEIDGLDDADPYDASEGQFVQASSESITTPNVTPSAGDKYLLTFVGFTRSAAFTAPPNGVGSWLNSFTEITEICTVLGSGTRDQIGVADRSVTANGSTAYSGGATSDGSGTANSRVGIIIAFNVAAGGTDATPTPAVVATTTTAPRPNVNVAAGPAVAATAAALPRPNVNVAAGPAVAATVAALPRADVNVSAGPAVVATSATVPRPAVDVVASPAVVATTVTLPQATPDVAGNATAQPAVVATVAAVPQPGIDIAAGPAVVPVTVTIPQPGANVTASPAVIACTVALATPTATGGTGVSPAAITTTIAVQATAVNVGAGPGTIAVTVTIPTPATGAVVKALSDPSVAHAVASVAAVSALRTSNPTAIAAATSTSTVG
jgi:hypothetical protein